MATKGFKPIIEWKSLPKRDPGLYIHFDMALGKDYTGCFIMAPTFTASDWFNTLRVDKSHTRASTASMITHEHTRW